MQQGGAPYSAEHERIGSSLRRFETFGSYLRVSGKRKGEVHDDRRAQRLWKWVERRRGLEEHVQKYLSCVGTCCWI